MDDEPDAARGDHDEDLELRKYTRGEANALLYEARSVLVRLQEIWLTAEPDRRAFESVQESDAGPVDVSLAHQRLIAGLWDVQPLVAWLRARDIVLRDPATGLIDFLSERDGEDCYLCWRLGEEDIGYWHGTDEGFDSRRSLPEG